MGDIPASELSVFRDQNFLDRNHCEDPKDRHSKQRSCDFEVRLFFKGRGCSEVMGFDGFVSFGLGPGEGKLVSKMFGSYIHIINIMSISCRFSQYKSE